MLQINRCKQFGAMLNVLELELKVALFTASLIYSSKTYNAACVVPLAASVLQKLKNSNYYVNFKTKKTKERRKNANNFETSSSKGLTKIIESSCNKTLIAATSANKTNDYARYNYCFTGNYVNLLAPKEHSHSLNSDNVDTGHIGSEHSRLISHHHESNLVFYEQDKFYIKQECNTNCIIYDNHEVVSTEVEVWR